MQNPEVVLEILSKKSKENPKFVFQRLYRLLFSRNMFMVAYAKMSSHEGNMTAGIDGETIDGFSKKLIDDLIKELRTERYYPKAVRRTYIPKKNSEKKRPSGIPSFRDKVVQEVIKMILEAIYEPIFSDSSHGYRPNRSCQTALYRIKCNSKGTSWVIEGDIKGFFDNINHDVMLALLSKKIDDGRFIGLIKRFLEAGYMEFREVYNTLTGTPQGGTISPILANIYLHELDTFMSMLELRYTRGKYRFRNPEYMKLDLDRFRKNKSGNTREAERILKEMRQLPTQNLMDRNYVRVKYTRYADDFVVMIIGNKKLAEKIREEIGNFLDTKLKLEMSMDKTKITNLTEENVRFLGYEIAKVIANSKIIRDVDGVRRREINGTIQLLVPTDVINEHLKPFMKDGKPYQCNARINDSVLDIVNAYNSEIWGLYNYYCLATDVSKKIGKFKYFHYVSLTKTIARKEQISVSKVIQKYGIGVKRKVGTGTRKLIGVSYKTKKGTKIMTYFNEPLKTHKQPTTGIDKIIVIIPTRCQLITRLNASQCEYCGKPTDCEVHHVRKLRDIKRKYAKRGKEIPAWVLRMASINRKTLVLCEDCHNRLHKGTLNDTAEMNDWRAVYAERCKYGSEGGLQKPIPEMD